MRCESISSAKSLKRGLKQKLTLDPLLRPNGFRDPWASKTGNRLDSVLENRIEDDVLRIDSEILEVTIIFNGVMVKIKAKVIEKN